MRLDGQGEMRPRWTDARGFAMAALLVGMTIMAVLMGAALPVWNKQAQREREEEYLFRAHEYARAVKKFRDKVANATPPNFDVLVEQRFLRRKYKDPLTGQDFQPVFQTAAGTAQPSGAGGAAGAITPSPGGTPTSGFGAGGTSGTPSTSGPGNTPTSAPNVAGAGVIGVVSKSKADSIKVYNGRTRHDQWAVTYMDVKPGKGLPPDILQAMNAAGRGQATGQPGQPGQPLGAPGGVAPGQFGQPVGAGGQPIGGVQGQRFGTPVQPIGSVQPPGPQPFGAAPGRPFGSPGQLPFGQPPQPGAQPSPGGGSAFVPLFPPPPKRPGG